MTNHEQSSVAFPLRRRGGSIGRGLFIVFLGGLALAAPLVAAKGTAFLLGLLLLAASVPEVAHAFFLREGRASNATFWGSLLTILVGVLLIAEPQLAVGALALLLGLSFLLGGLGKLFAGILGQRQPGQDNLLIDGTVHVLLGFGIAAQ